MVYRGRWSYPGRWAKAGFVLAGIAGLGIGYRTFLGGEYPGKAVAMDLERVHDRGPSCSNSASAFSTS